jgi:hypothetical protein
MEDSRPRLLLVWTTLHRASYNADMSIDEIRKYVRKQPFEPFRVFISDGSHYDVLHHDFMIVSPRVVEIGVAKDAKAFPDRIISCDPLHITRIAPINGAKRTNGRKKRP